MVLKLIFPNSETGPDSDNKHCKWEAATRSWKLEQTLNIASFADCIVLADKISLSLTISSPARDKEKSEA